MINFRAKSHHSLHQRDRGKPRGMRHRIPYMVRSSYSLPFYSSLDLFMTFAIDLKIPHRLCLPETCQDIISRIDSWAQSDGSIPSRILCIVGGEGSGKSSIAATLAVKWKREGILATSIFLSDLSGSLGSSKIAVEITGHKPSSLSRALSSICRLRRSSSRRARSHSLPFEELNNTLGATVVQASKATVIIVDGLDYTAEGEWQRMTGLLNDILAKHSHIRVLVTTRSESSPWLEPIRTQTTLERLPSPLDPRNVSDIAVYVSSRLSLLLSEPDRQRVVDAVEGNWGDAVRLCDEITEFGNPERALDAVLYKEVVRKHPGEHVKVVLA